MDESTALAQGAYESLADDEALRGDLTDAGFGPLLDWAASALMEAAGRLTAAPDQQARPQMDAAARSVKAAIRAAVQTAQRPTPDQRAALAREPLVAERLGPDAAAALAALPLGADADANAASIAGLLQRAGP